MRSETYTLPAICYGEILWDMLPDGPQPGGAPLNVAYHLSNLGLAASIVSRIGNDSKGNQLETLLDEWHINKHMLQRDVIHPTRDVIANLNIGTVI